MMTHTRNWWKKKGKPGWQRPLLFLTIILALVWLSGLLPNPRPVSAQSGTTITLTSAATTINGCETLDVFIRINDVVGLYGADVVLSFDPTVLEVTALTESEDFLRPPFWVTRNVIDNTAGTVRLALTQLNPTPPATGSGNFARITFLAKGAGSNSPLHFSYVQLAGLGGAPIDATAVDGSLTTTPPATTTAAITKLNPTTARLSWTAVSGVSSYNVYKDTYAYFTPTTPYHTTSALTFEDADALGNVATNNFYVVRSACANGFESANANRVGEFDYPLVTGTAPQRFNLIALPLDSTASLDPFKASSLAIYAGPGVRQVLKWDASIRGFTTYIPILSPPELNFDLTIGDGYFLLVDDRPANVLTFVGNVPPLGSASSSLLPPAAGGCLFNTVYIPLDRTNITKASELAAAVGGVTQVLNWDPNVPGFKTFIPGLSPIELDFETKAGYAYFLCLNRHAPTSWP